VTTINPAIPVELAPSVPISSESTDAELIGRFAQNRDERAFAQLVTRHGPLVLSICRRILRHAEDGEDVFQATFLALAREAGRGAWQNSLAGWIYKVAYRSALRVRAQRAARRELPVEDVSMIPDAQLDQVAELDAQQKLYDELLELPGHYRDAIVVCCVEGLDRDQASRQLGCSELVLKGRLQRGRQMLLRRLGLQGLFITGALAAAQQSVKAAEAAVTPELVANTTEAAIAWASGEAALSSLLSNPTAYPQGAWLTMLQTPLFKGLFLGSFVAVAVWGGSALLGSGRFVDLGAGVQLHAGESPAEGNEATFLALADASDPSDESEVAENTKSKSKADPHPTPEKAAQEIQKALQRPARMEFIETPLNDVAEFLREQFQIPILLDKKSMEDQGVDSATPITMNLAGVSLQSGLKLMLQPLGLKHVIKDEVLMVTTERKADNEVVTRPYRVDNLDGDLTELTEVIRSTVAPDKWFSSELPEAKGQIKPFGRTLVILQTEEVHEKITKLLEDLGATVPPM